MPEPVASVIAVVVILASLTVAIRAGRRTRAARNARRQCAILDVLAARPQGMYGLFLSQETRLGPDQLFPVLKRLEQRGLVEAWWVNSWNPAGPRRRYYGLTDAGKRAHETYSAGSSPEPAHEAGGSDGRV